MSQMKYQKKSPEKKTERNGGKQTIIYRVENNAHKDALKT